LPDKPNSSGTYLDLISSPLDCILGGVFGTLLVCLLWLIWASLYAKKKRTRDRAWKILRAILDTIVGVAAAVKGLAK
jgi:hypothetical protein